MLTVINKKTLSIILAFLITATALFPALAADAPEAVNPEAYPAFADKDSGALFAHADLGGSSPQAWQRWGSGYTGINAGRNARYFFLPNTADDSRVEIYNNYSSEVVVGGVSIAPYTSAFVNYTSGSEVSAVINGHASNFTVYKSDSEAAVYVNDTTNSYTDVDGIVRDTDLYSFLIQNKENSVKGSSCAIAGSNGVVDTTLKKIKGRGNTNWTQTDKKPFNLQFNDNVNIGHVSGKKFSLVSNAKDSTLLRNTIMYNLGNEVGSPYSPDQSFIDFFVNGEYRGCYIACQKVDMGKSSLVSLKDSSDKDETGFNFLVEVDVWNFRNDTYFVTDKGYHVVLKTPDLEDFETDSADWQNRYEYIKATYQQFEDALYDKNLSELEKVCDINSLATQYLLQEFGKNCDGGYTSTYFTYNADEGKFYAAPLWDCDSDLGAVNCLREGCSTSTCYISGWTTKTATYKSDNRIVTVNPLGQAFKLKGTTADGQTFDDIVRKIWNENFIPKINILLGKSDADGRLKSIDEYAQSIANASYINYIMWDYMWYCASYNSGLTQKYSRDYAGELSYLKDWTAARADWLSSQYRIVDPTETKTLYFYNNLNWDNVYFYCWTDGNAPMTWPGEEAGYVDDGENNVKIYKANVPSNLTKIIFNGGASAPQTVNIDITDAYNAYILSTASGKQNNARQPIYNVTPLNYTAPETQPSTQETTTAEVSSTAPTTQPVTDNTVEAYNAVFNTDENTSVDIYYTQDYTNADETNVKTAVARNRDTGEADVSGDGQINFSVSTASGYVVDNISVEGDYKNLKDISNNTYRITKIESDLKITITTKKDDTEPIRGDVSLDGKVNIRDATLIRKHIARIITLSDKQIRAIGKPEGETISVSDATKLQKYLAGIISEY